MLHKKKFIISLVLFFNINTEANQENIKQKEDLSYKEIVWDWAKIDPLTNPKITPESLIFPKNFIWGTATAAHQVDGDCNCQWIEFEKTKKLEPSGKACDHWNRYEQDIELMKNLGVNAYRFSIEWSKIEPEQGKFNKEAIDHYHDVINALIKNNITPVITLHHFTHPIWFEKKRAFEKEENIKYFVNFAKEMFDQYSNKVKIWCTINEPGVYAFSGYIHGTFPTPDNKPNILLAGIVNKNLIIAHIEAYKALKSMANGKDCQIGLTHSITQYNTFCEPSKCNPLYKLEEFLAYYLNNAFYDAMMQFFITGKFVYRVPTILQLILSGTLPISLNSLFPTKFSLYTDVKYEYLNENNKYDAKEIMDFIGIQPYSNVLVYWKNKDAATKPSLRPSDIINGNISTDMPYRICPESLYRAINQASFIGVPIYVTENGIADSKDDRRELFIRRYLYALHKAIKDGYNVRGYFYWSLLDNFEWAFGYKMKFGLYEVDFKTQERKLRKGAFFLKNVLTKNNIKN